MTEPYRAKPLYWHDNEDGSCHLNEKQPVCKGKKANGEYCGHDADCCRFNGCMTVYDAEDVERERAYNNKVANAMLIFESQQRELAEKRAEAAEARVKDLEAALKESDNAATNGIKDYTDRIEQLRNEMKELREKIKAWEIRMARYRGIEYQVLIQNVCREMREAGKE